MLIYNLWHLDKASGYDSDGRAVASNSRGPRFEYFHRQFFSFFTINCIGFFNKASKQFLAKTACVDNFENKTPEVYWLREETHVLKVVGLNPHAVNLMDNYSHIFAVKIVTFVWKDENKLKRGRVWPIF